MNIFGGRGGGTAKWNRNRYTERWSLGVLGLAVALMVGAFVLPGEASGGVSGGGWIPVPPADGGGTKVGDEGKPPQKASQECFNDFIDNQKRCKLLWCEPSSLLWFDWTDCLEPYHGTCQGAAKQVFDCCLAGGPPCGGN
jgi:hypothetical protein